MENKDQMLKDSDMIFTQITTGAFENWDEVNQAVVMLYVPDMTISRSGISHALKRLEDYYKTGGLDM
jgi:hypothetical protein